MRLFENVQLIKALAPAADRYNTDPVSDYVNMAVADEITFLLYQQGGTTGKATVTVLAADDNAGTNAAGIAFKYRKVATGDSAAVGAVTDVAAAGFDTDANKDSIYAITVRAQDLGGKKFVALKTTEAVNDPVNAVVIGVLSGLKYGASVPVNPLS